MSYDNGLNIDLGASNFDFGNGTLSESREQEQDDTKTKADAAEIIKASSEGLNSITGLVSLFTGNQPSNQPQTYTPPPTTKNKVNPFLIGGVGVGVLLLIFLLIKSNNGKPTK